MATPVWPIELPQKVLASGYNEKLRDGRIFVRTSTGPGKSRRRFSSAVIPMNASIYLTHAQKARFERFWYEETNGGVKAFIIPDQTHDGINISTQAGETVATSNGFPLTIKANWLAMFGQEPPSIVPMNGGYFTISFTLNVLP